jgi:hypothetical protein
MIKYLLLLLPLGLFGQNTSLTVKKLTATEKIIVNGITFTGVATVDTNYINFRGNNVRIGNKAGKSNTSGRFNFIGGDSAGYNITTGYANVIIGANSAYTLNSGSENIIIGNKAGEYMNNGSGNVLLGIYSGRNITYGQTNTCIGRVSGYSITTASNNVLIGNGSGYSLTTHGSSVIIGSSTGQYVTGEGNVIIGCSAASNLTTGAYNNINGLQSAYNLTTGSNNLILGNSSGKYLSTHSNRLIIDNQDRANVKGDTTQSLIYGVFNADTLKQKITINGNVRVSGLITTGDTITNAVKLSKVDGLKLYGTATQFEDENLDPTTLTGTGNAPTLGTFASTGIHIATFSATQLDEVEGKREIPHKTKLASDIVFHAHCYPTTTNTGNVRLGLEYFFSQEGVAVTTSTTIYIVFAAGGTAWAKQSQDFAAITTPNELGSQLHFRFFRDGANVADTYTGGLAISTIGFHYEIDALGSRGITTK